MRGRDAFLSHSYGSLTDLSPGIGVGGVYPLSATKAAEDGGDHHGNVDPTADSWAFFWQVPGTMVSR